MRQTKMSRVAAFDRHYKDAGQNVIETIRTIREIAYLSGEDSSLDMAIEKIETCQIPYIFVSI